METIKAIKVIYEHSYYSYYMEIEISKITERGQVTIPQEFRRELNLKTGEKIVFFKEGGRLFLEPMSRVKNIEKLKEDMEFARRTEEAWKEIDAGNYEEYTTENFLDKLKKW